MPIPAIRPDSSPSRDRRTATGGEPPLHVHRNEDEFFLVLEGQLKVLRGHEELSLKAGQSAFLPRNVAHTFKIVSPQARFLNTITPGGFEQFFRDMGQPLNLDGTVEWPQQPFSVEEISAFLAFMRVLLCPDFRAELS